MPSFFRPQGAFSLLEGLITVFLMSVVIFFAIPNFQRILNEKAMQGCLIKISKLWEFAKTEAMLSHQRLWVCQRVNQHQCEMRWNEKVGIGVYPEISGILSEKSLYKISDLPRACQIQWIGFLNNDVVISPTLSHQALSGRFEITCGKIRYFLVSNRVGQLRIEKILS